MSQHGRAYGLSSVEPMEETRWGLEEILKINSTLIASSSEGTTGREAAEENHRPAAGDL